MTSIEDTIASLREGDEVEVTYRGTATGERIDGYVTLRLVDGRMTMLIISTAADVCVIKRADPGCPFPMGSKVRVKGGDGRVYTVRDWYYNDLNDQWEVMCAFVDPVPGGLGYFHEDLELVPENPEPPVGTPVWWNGEWWMRSLNGDYFGLTGAEMFTYRAWADMLGAIPASVPEAKA